VLLTLFGAACESKTDPTQPAIPKESSVTAALVDESYLVVAWPGVPAAAAAAAVTAAGGSVTSDLSQVGLLVVSAPAGFVEALAKSDAIQSVLPDLALPPLAAEAGFAGSDAVQAPSIGADEPMFGLQSALQALRVPAPWAAGARGGGARVAVLDDGIDHDHPDLAARFDPHRNNWS
jgi:lantibiotic leader peptide-processing serine protease